MSESYKTALQVLQNKLGDFDSPLNILRKFGLPVPNAEQTATVLETISPAADIEEMITGSEEFSKGDYISGGAKMLGGLAGVFVPGSAKIRSAGKAVGDIVDKKLLDMKYTRETPKKKGAFSSMDLAAEGKITDQEAIGGLFNPYTIKNKEMILGPDSSNLNTSRIEISTFPPPGEKIPGFGMKAADDIGLPASKVGNRIDNNAIEVQTNLIEGSKWKWEGKVPKGFKNNTHLVSMKGGSKLKKASKGPTGHSYATKVIYEKGGNLSTYDTRAEYVKELHKSIPESLAALKIKIPKEVKKVTKELKDKGKSTEEIKEKVNALKKKLTRDYKGDNPKGKPTTVGVPEFGKKIGKIKKGGIIQPVYDQIIMREAGGQVMPMQYGGGLSDAYSTLSDRRRNQNMYGMGDAPMQQMPSQMSSVFQDPMEASAFSPVNMEQGGDIVVPTIYRSNGGDVDDSDDNFGGFGSEGFGDSFGDLGPGGSFDSGNDTISRGVPPSEGQFIGSQVPSAPTTPQDKEAEDRSTYEQNLYNKTFEGQKGNLLGSKTKAEFDRSVRNALENELINAGVKNVSEALAQMMAGAKGTVAAGSLTGRGGLSTYLDRQNEDTEKALQSRIEELKKEGKVVDEDKGFFGGIKSMLTNDLVGPMSVDPQVLQQLKDRGVTDFTPYDKFSPFSLGVGALNAAVQQVPIGLMAAGLSKLTGSEVVGTFTDPLTGQMMALDTLGKTTFISPDALTSGAADESGFSATDVDAVVPVEEKKIEEKEDKKSPMSKLLAQRINNASTIDPNVKIIMDIYGISQEEAQEFLGKKGVGTGSASEFEGI